MEKFKKIPNPPHPPTPPCRVLIVMGVSGCGKSTVGKVISEFFAGKYFEGDDYHSCENISKMSAQIPLTDADRAPWLARLHEEIISATPAGSFTVLSCSALKKSYRDVLRGGADDVWFLYLQGSFEEIFSRISSRQGHFMKPGLLESQFAALEEPLESEKGIIFVPIQGDLPEVQKKALESLLIFQK